MFLTNEGLGDKPQEPISITGVIAPDRLLYGSGDNRSVLLLHALQGEVASEGTAAAKRALHLQLGTVALKHVFHDGEA